MLLVALIQFDVAQRVVGSQFGVAGQGLDGSEKVTLRPVNLAQQAISLGVVGIPFDGFL